MRRSRGMRISYSKGFGRTISLPYYRAGRVIRN